MVMILLDVSDFSCEGHEDQVIRLLRSSNVQLQLGALFLT